MKGRREREDTGNTPSVQKRRGRGSQIGKEKEDSVALDLYENTCWVKYSVRYSFSREP